MATTDDLIISIRADVDVLAQQLRQVDQRLQQTQQNAGNTGNAIQSAASSGASGLATLAAAAGAAAAALGALAIATANDVREFNSLANSLGLSYRQLERLESVSKSANMETDMMIDLAKTLNEQIWEATNGNQDFADSFAALGLTMEQLQSMSVDEQLLAVSNALGQVSDQSDKAKIGATLFGDNWLAVLKLTEISVQNNVKAFDELSIKLTDIDVTRLIELDVQADKLLSNVGMLSKKISSDLAPVLTVVTKKFNELFNVSEDEQLTPKISLLTDILIQFSGLAMNVSSVVSGGFKLILAAVVEVASKLALLSTPLVAVFDLVGSAIGYIVRGYQELYNIHQRIQGLEEVKLIEPFNGELLDKHMAKIQNMGGAAKEAASDAIKDITAGVTGAAGEAIIKEMEAAAVAFGKSSEEKDTGTSKKKAGAGEKEGSKGDDKLNELRKAANALYEELEKSVMDEQQLENKAYDEKLSALRFYLNAKAMSQEQFNAAEYNLNKAWSDKIFAAYEEDEKRKKELDEKRQQDEDAKREAKVANMQALLEGIKSEGQTEIEALDAAHAQKMDVLRRQAEEEGVFGDELKMGIEEAEKQHLAKRADMLLGSGNKMQGIQKAFNKGALDGALAFFSADLGGMSQHSRKMFELQKAANIAQVIMNTPTAVSAAMKAGWAAGGSLGGWGAPAMAAAYGAAALAQQVAQLRSIQSASFGGGGGGGSAPSGSVGSAGSGAADAPQQALQQRMVNLNLYGNENTMYSKESVRTLIQRIGEEVKDGAVLRVN